MELRVSPDAPGTGSIVFLSYYTEQEFLEPITLQPGDVVDLPLKGPYYLLVLGDIQGFVNATPSVEDDEPEVPTPDKGVVFNATDLTGTPLSFGDYRVYQTDQYPVEITDYQGIPVLRGATDEGFIFENKNTFDIGEESLLVSAAYAPPYGSSFILVGSIFSDPAVAIGLSTLQEPLQAQGTLVAGETQSFSQEYESDGDIEIITVLLTHQDGLISVDYWINELSDTLSVESSITEFPGVHPVGSFVEEFDFPLAYSTGFVEFREYRGSTLADAERIHNQMRQTYAN